MNKAWIILTIFLSSPSFAEPAAPCGVVLKPGKEVQIIPLQGKVESRAVVNTAVSCGSTVLTHSEEVWLKASDQTVIRLGKNSFFEWKGNDMRLWRGQLMITSETDVDEHTITTPNAILNWHSGSSWLSYDPSIKETAAVCFLRNAVLKNRFEKGAQVSLKTAEISKLILKEPRTVPTQPEIVSGTSAREVLSRFSFNDAEREELLGVVEHEFESRAKSLTADIENWDDLSKEDAKRDIASESQHTAGSEALDRREAQRTMDLLKKRLYGAPEDLKMVDEEEGHGARKPAAASREQALPDAVYDRQQQRKKSQVKKVMEEIDRLQ